MAKVAEVAPAGTITEAGTEAAVLELLSITAMPPEGAGALKVTVFPLIVVPPLA